VHVGVPVSKTLNGTAYYKRPVRKIVFNDVPSYLKSFSDLTSTTPTYDQLLTEYSATPLTDDGNVSTFSLTPTKEDARVKSLNIVVYDSTHLVEQVFFSYKSGETLAFVPAYMASGTYQLLSHVTIAAHFTSYHVDGTLTFSNYQLGVPVTL